MVIKELFLYKPVLIVVRSGTKKIIRRSTLVLVIAIIAMSALAQGLMNLQFRQSDARILKHFKQKSYTPAIKNIAFKGYNIRYLELYHSDELPLLVFIHGSPGSSLDYIKYLKDDTLNQHFNMISLDRPGYGYSGFGRSMTSIASNAELIHKLIKQYKCNKIVLLGHSYGGPIALRVAMDYPDAVGELILLAPALDPENEVIFKFAHLGKWPVTRMLTPTALKVAADEKFDHADELQKMLPLYEQVKCNVMHMHSKKDDLVPFVNVAFLKRNLPDALLNTITLDKGNHFLPWTRFELVKSKLLEKAW